MDADKCAQYLKENLGSIKVQLTPEDLEQVRKEAESADVAQGGSRYPPGSDKFLFGDTPKL